MSAPSLGGLVKRVLAWTVGVRPSPSAELWRRTGEVLGAALELPPAERAAFLDRACADRPELRREVESLLAAHTGRGILDRPAAELVEPLVSPRGRTVAHYRVLEALGGGGMGIVHKARDLRLDRVVALKFLPPHLSADERAKERFRAEAQAAASLDHPNICTVHEIGETGEGELFIAMPFYEGETLKARIGRGPLALQEALSYAIQAAHGLAKAHERGIVHRDVKPANLLVTTDGVVKIVDFGIAKLVGPGVTGPGAVPGTEAYMSPEQARGDPVDGRTDLWSLGVVLHEMLTGERPSGDGPHPAAPPALERVLARALAPRPDDRYATAAELARDLERARDAGDAAPEPPGVLPEGERRQATIVVSCVSGYAGLVERLVPEELERLTGRLRAVAAEVAGRHGGTLNRFAADELALLFGIPLTHEDDCHRAVRAALELHARAQRLSADLEERGAPPLRLQTGVDTGRTVARPAGEAGSGYHIAGAAVVSAGQLCAQAAAGEVWITPECQRLVGPFFETEARAPLTLPERRHPLTPRRVVAETRLQTRLEAAQRVGLTAYTGRERELAALRSCLESALGGEGRFVTVSGEAGMGKSRLLHEFRAEIDAERCTVLQGRCQAQGGGGAAYAPFIEVLRAVLRLGAPAAPGDQPRTTAERVREIGPELLEFVPLYLHLLSIPSEELPVPKHLQGEQFGLAVQEALAALLTLSARRRPAVVLLEDWHWADEASHAVLRQVAEVAPEYPLLVAATYRPGTVRDWGSPGSHASIVLQPLEEPSSIEMLASILHARSFPEELGALLHERTGGNPFFLEEICQTLAEEGALRVEGGHAVLTGSLDALDLPDTVQAVIRTRLDRLDRDAREVLRLASVVGREFTRGILELTLQGVGRLPNALQTLKDAGLVQQTRVVPEAGFRFKHALTQEVAYASLLEHQRRDLHGRVGEAIETLHGPRLEEHLDRLAHHFSQAEEWGRAVRYGIRSAERAAALSRFAEALQILERAQGWLARLEPGVERQGTLVEVLLQQERLCETLGLRGRQQRIVDELIALLEPAGDPASLAEAYLRQGDLYTLLRRFDAAEAALGRSLRIRRDLGDAVGVRNTLRSLGLMRWHAGRNAEALEHIEEALAIDRERGDLEAMVGDLSNLGPVLKAMGEYDRARAALEEALELSQRAPAGGPDAAAEGELLLKRSYILQNLANIHRGAGENERALEYLQRARELTIEKRLPIQLSYHYTAIAHIHLQQGRVEESIRDYREAVDLTRRARYTPGLSQALRFLGELLLGLDRHDEALPHLREAAGLFAQLKDRAAEALMWSRIAHVHERTDRRDEAVAAWGRARELHGQAGDAAGELEALEGIARSARACGSPPARVLGHYRDALELAERLRDRAAQGRLHNTLGILEWSRGAHEEALLHYEKALALFHELGDAGGAGLMLNSIGVTLRALGRRVEARARLREAVAFHHRTGGGLLEGHALAALGDVHSEMGEAEEAVDCYERSLRLRREIGDRRGEGWMLHHLARALGSRELAAEAAGIAAEAGDPELSRACERMSLTPGT